MTMIKSSDRISVEIWNQQYAETELNSHMFIEDLYQSIVPYSYNSGGSNASCELIPMNKAAENFLRDLLSRCTRFNDNGLENSIWETIRYIAHSLAED